MKNATVIASILYLWSFSLIAQIKDLSNHIPIDPTIKMGKLSNGLTYYIKHNAKPKNKAELRLVLNAGSILEDEDQLGLAHFIEHMAFNGTEKFPKNDLIDYLQSLGIEFGADLNAHTGFDETVYKLSVPTDEKTLGTSLQVLRDWADGITFSHEEIDNERGVVAEELRARSGAGMRMYYKSIPVITNNSRYADRLPIGTLDVIMNSKYDVMKRFYNDWYRPDLMALVLVGDFDVEETEIKVKEIFKSIKPVKNPKERVYYEISDNEEPKITVITDKETKGVKVSIYIKKQETEVETLQDYKQVLLRRLYSGMLRERLNEVSIKSNAPFLSATAGIGNFLANMDCYFLRANLKEDKVTEGIDALLTESERAKQFGFTATELERYKALLLNNADIRRKETGKLSTKYYIEQYIDNFTDHVPIPSDAFKYEFYKEVFPGISVEDVNNVSKQWVRDVNIAVVINAIEKADLKLPTENDIEKILKNVTSKDIEAYKDKLGDVQLMANKPEPGKIIKEIYNEKVDVTTWQLANGITIIAKPTQFQNDLISMNGFRPGGSSIAPDSLYVSARNAGNIIGSSGVNEISKTDLKKLNMGKTLSISPRINFYGELFSGSSSSKDLESMLQMTHLYFTKPNKDKNVFNAFKENLKATYKDQDKSPGSYFEKRISEVMTKKHLRAIPLTGSQIEDGLKLDAVYDFYKERFSSANGFTFIFVGSFQIDSLKEYVTRYLGSLSSNLNETSSWKDIGLRYTQGGVKEIILKGIDDKSKVDMRFIGGFEFSLEEKKKLSLLGKLLKIKLTEEMREKMAGVYGVQVSGYASEIPYHWYRMNVRFTCDPDNVDKLIAKVFEEIEKIKKQGASSEDLNKIKEAELANTKDALEFNGYWIFKLKEAYKYGLDFESVLDYKTSINKIDSKMFQDAANTYFDMNNYAEFILLPEE
ncbi:M16 family metallopeptidase [Flavivirga rizhaonensis]|uniref:Insulinase family protein n=1 Tax=Flavivirga rizhaonensis TaxID=2559571 RepID=A0A4S1DW77_9FLAO|nr:M16 family metallopeptidase [Flavivirga rizhaonensis]TGV02163.1 insulinase family protein [Flavivirga rizhaonensis]